MAYQIGIDRISVLIANGTALSAAVPLGNKVVIGIVMPGTWTAAALTFQASADDTTFNNVVSTGGTELNYTVAASTFIQIDPATWHGVTNLKIRSGTSGSPVNQGADRTIILITRPWIT